MTQPRSTESEACLLSEFGIVLLLKAEVVRREVGLSLADLPGWANIAIGDSLSELHHLDGRIAESDQHIKVMAQSDERGRQLMDIPGLGRTTASALHLRCLLESGGGHRGQECAHGLSDAQQRRGVQTLGLMKRHD